MRSGKKSKGTLKQMNMRTQPKSVRNRESNPKRGIDSIIGLSQETRRSPNKQYNYIYKRNKKNKKQSQK